MIKQAFEAMGTAARNLFQSWRVLLVMLALYLAVLGSVYLFFSTREATVAQLLLTLALGILAPVIKLVIQMMAIRYESEDRVGRLLLSSLADFWKLAVIVLPIALIVGVAVYYIGSLELKGVQETVRSVAAPRRIPAPRVPAVRSMPWQAVALSSLQYLLIGLVLPLASIHLCIDAARRGLRNAFKAAPRTIARAFAPRSVLVYAIGFVVFAVIPFFLVTKRTPAATPWIDVALLGARLALAVTLSLIGWVVSVAALTKLSPVDPLGAEQDHKPRFNQGAEHVPAES